ncbi:UNVERIFIED_CONTAM: hypothetical protein PYX00_008599 [Menopon gallinae]|uniref:DNA ligase n=1 Tax=Menopon gallinae TaxID=328185 RepID=A0AAW2HPV2_9NEOP
MKMEETGEEIEKPFYVDRAKTGRAGCKKCKKKIDQGELRFAKIGHNPFGAGTMKMWHHIPCIFEVFAKQRATTKKIESPDDIGGWFDISEDDRQEIMSHFSPELKQVFSKNQPAQTPKKNQETEKISSDLAPNDNEKDMSFRAFRKVCSDVAEAASYLVKTNIVKEFLTHGSDGSSFKGDVELWCRLLLPGVVKRNYNLQSKQLIKIFSRILDAKQEEMLEDLEKGDVAETIATFFQDSQSHQPSSKSKLSMREVDNFLESLSGMTKEDEQTFHFTKIIKKCTANDLKMIIRLIKHDLRINCGAKHILEALHPDAYKAFQASRDIKAVVKNALKAKSKAPTEVKEKNVGMNVNLKLMTPVLPMLAQACTSVDMAMKKCPNGMFSEVKYDGERVQLHKEGNNFKYFSRSLKPVLPHKVNHFKDYIPQAFPHGQDLILDAEILMVDNSGKPLPFGTLGIHKKSEFKDANVCLFVFDCIYYNGDSLMNTPIKERKRILKKNMVEIKNHIMFSETEEIHKSEDLEAMMTKVFRLGLEGLVLKPLESTYEPGKRHWLKMKKDYLYEGAMADSADLVVLGAWFGTGNKGGIMSIFLMGCYDESTKTWRTVTKVHSGHDDSTLERLQKELDVIKISKDVSKVPSWLKCTKTMVPDFVAKDPRKMPVWEVTGAEFTQNQVHTAEGISIRFPRVTRIRDDKDWATATTLSELKELFKASKDTATFTLKGTAEDENGVKSKSASVKSDSPSSKTSKSSSSESSSPPKKGKSKGDDISSSASKRSKPASTDSPAPKKPKLRVEEDTEETDTDEDVSPEASASDEVIANPLPDVFDGCVIQMPKRYKDTEFLRRYLIAYGAVLYDPTKNNTIENAKNKVTHVIHVKGKSALTKEDYWADNVRHVQVNWIWDSIKLLERQKEKNYAVICS